MNPLIVTALKIVPAIKFQLGLRSLDVYQKCGVSYLGLPIALFFTPVCSFLATFFGASNLGRGQWVALVQWEAAASTPAINHGSDRYLTADDGCPCIVNGALISAPPPTLKGGAFIQPSGSSIMDGFSKP